MRFRDSISWHPDADNIRRIMRENEHGTKKFTVVKLPCGHGRVEVTKPEDQWLTCTTCLQKFLLKWSPLEGRHQVLAADNAKLNQVELPDWRKLRF